MMLPRENQSFELKTCPFLNAQASETMHVSAADLSFEGMNFSTKNSRTDFPVYLQKEKKKGGVISSLKCCGAFFKTCCISVSTVSIANVLDEQGRWCV